MSDNDERQYVCKTQSDDHHKIVVGLGPIIPRWKPGTTLKYFVDTKTFLTASDADFTAQAFKQAADEWNGLNLGVTFTQAESRATAHFELEYSDKYQYSAGDSDGSGYEPGVLAWAFFPMEVARPVVVTMYGLYHRGSRAILKEVFLHELGHTFGLRHEFALYAKEQSREERAPEEDDLGAKQFMEPNPFSVMAYKFPPKIQQTDIDGVRAFYKLPEGHKIGGSAIKDYVPKLLK